VVKSPPARSISLARSSGPSRAPSCTAKAPPPDAE
jgi:hypothetical protein